jgi:hypothetical protein
VFRHLILPFVGLERSRASRTHRRIGGYRDHENKSYGDLGYSRTEEQTREAIAPMLEAGAPPIVDHNADSTGTDFTGYLGFSVFVLDDDEY